MKTRLLIVIAVGLVLFPLIPLLQFHMGSQVMADGFSVSGRLVAGFVAFMFHKHMTDRDKKSLIITIVTVAASYLVLTTMIILASNTLQILDTGDGIDAWSGTADGMERQVHFDWGTVETIWIVILAIPGVIIAYKFYERIKLKY